MATKIMTNPTSLPENRFKRALKEGHQQIGLWNSLASPYVAEVTAGSGADWLLLDGEHSPLTVESILGLLQAMQGYDAAAVVRPLWNDPLLIKQLLDIGVMNLLVPNIRNAEEARQCVQYAQYPPRGTRGVASGIVRASRFGRIADYMQRVEEELCIVVQVETQTGLDNIEAIAAVDGIDGIFIGPADLAADMGFPGKAGHPEVMSAVERGIARIKATGKAAGVLAIDDGQLQRYIDAGSLMTAVGLDVHLLARSSEALVKRYKDAARTRGEPAT